MSCSYRRYNSKRMSCTFWMYQIQSFPHLDHRTWMISNCWLYHLPLALHFPPHTKDEHHVYVPHRVSMHLNCFHDLVLEIWVEKIDNYPSRVIAMKCFRFFLPKLKFGWKNRDFALVRCFVFSGFEVADWPWPHSLPLLCRFNFDRNFPIFLD